MTSPRLASMPYRAGLLLFFSWGPIMGCGAEPAAIPAAVLEAEGDTPCATDDDCQVWYNGCFETASCWHTDDVDATPDILCDPPDYAPPDAQCVCDEVCVVR